MKYHSHVIGNLLRARDPPLTCGLEYNIKSSGRLGDRVGMGECGRVIYRDYDHARLDLWHQKAKVHVLFALKFPILL